MAWSKYPEKVWKQIKKEWAAGQLSISDISRNFGPSRGAILARAKVQAWASRGTLSDEVRREIATRLIDGTDESDTFDTLLTPDETSDAIQTAASRGLNVIKIHKGLLARLLEQVELTLDDLKNMQQINLDLIRAQRLKNRSKMVGSIVKTRTDAMDAVSKVLARAIPLQRHAFSLDSEKGEIMTIQYITPEMKKPPGTGLSEDTWEQDESKFEKQDDEED